MLTEQHKNELRDLVQECLKKIADRKRKNSKEGVPDSVYLMGWETLIIDVQNNWYEKFFKEHTLDYELTKKMIKSQCDFWNREIDKLAS